MAEESVSHGQIVEAVQRGFADIRRDITDTNRDVAAVRQSIAVMAESSSHMSVELDRHAKARQELKDEVTKLGETMDRRLGALEKPFDRAKALAWAVGLILGVPAAIAAFIGGMLAIVGLLKPPA
jgi:chromosome segregation ATPase